MKSNMLVKYYEKNFRKQVTVLKALIIINAVKKTSGNIVRTFLKTSPKYSLSSVKMNVTHILGTH